MQTLFIQEKRGLDASGKQIKAERAVQIIRSWSDSSGKSLYLHASGIYGYKDGAPAKDASEFDLIGNKLQRQAAEAWWQRKGKKLSEEYYGKKEESERKALLESTPDFASVGLNILDQALYARRPAAKRQNALFTEGMHWWEFGFKDRPPWWGYLVKAEDASWYYKITNPDTVGLKPETAGGEDHLDS